MNKIIRFGVLILMVGLYSQISFAQNTPDKKGTKVKINQKDNKGRRQGMWVLSAEAIRGEPAYTEFGTYLHDWKTGSWYKLNGVGDLVSIENYKKDMLDGEVKYFVKGQVTVIGSYRGLNPDVKIDTILVIEPVTGEETLVGVEADRGSVRHGTWRYYDELTGNLTKVEEYQVDSLIYEEYFTLSKADSAFYEERNKNLPHMRKDASTKSQKKRHSYLN